MGISRNLKRPILLLFPNKTKAPPNGEFCFVDRKIVSKKVSLKLLEDPGKIHRRMCTVEHPSGTVKWYGGAYYVLCKGIRKVTGEIGLSFLAYNLRRAINMVGTRALIEEILAG